MLRQLLQMRKIANKYYIVPNLFKAKILIIHQRISHKIFRMLLAYFTNEKEIENWRLNKP